MSLNGSVILSYLYIKFVIHFKSFILDGYEDPEGARRWLGLMTLLGRIGQLVQTQGTSGKEKQAILQEFHGLLQGVPSVKH